MATPGLHHRSERSAVTSDHIARVDMLPQRRGPCTSPTWPPGSTDVNIKQAAGMNAECGVIPIFNRQHRREHYRRRRRVKQLCPTPGFAPSSIQVSILTDRTTTIRASVKTCSSSSCSPSRGGDGDVSLSAHLSATVIPKHCSPVAIVGTFAVMFLSATASTTSR